LLGQQTSQKMGTEHSQPHENRIDPQPSPARAKFRAVPKHGTSVSFPHAGTTPQAAHVMPLEHTRMLPRLWGKAALEVSPRLCLPSHNDGTRTVVQNLPSSDKEADYATKIVPAPCSAAATH
jgi:hypothetical protein